MENFLNIIEAGEFDHYGVRAHRGAAAAIGKSLGNSKVWIDGEMTDEDLPGICTIKVSSRADLEKAVSCLRSEYCWDGAQIVLVGGYVGEYGEDVGEFIIRDNLCLAVL